MEINKLITPYNRWEGRAGNRVEWIVLHYTANVGDTAKGNAQYFASQYLGASAHFFVDEREVWQSVELGDTAWHCGDNPPSKNGCTNRTSIGIEMCTSYDKAKGGYYIKDAVVDNTVDLVEYLLALYPDARLCRHFDVTGKRCPEPWVRVPEEWEKFLKKIEENKPMTPAEKQEFEALKSRVETLAAKVAANAEADRMTRRDVAKLDNRTKVQYNSVEECPEWAEPTVNKLVKRGALRGDGEGLGLTDDMTRTLVIVDRAGGFDK